MTQKDVSIEIKSDNSDQQISKSASQKHWLLKMKKDITDAVNLPKAKIALGFAIGMAALYIVTHYPDGDISKIGHLTSGSDLLHKKGEVDNFGKELSKRRNHSENQSEIDSNYNDLDGFLVGTAMLVGIPTLTCILACVITYCNKRQVNNEGESMEMGVHGNPSE